MCVNERILYLFEASPQSYLPFVVVYASISLVAALCSLLPSPHLVLLWWTRPSTSFSSSYPRRLYKHILRLSSNPFLRFCLFDFLYGEQRTFDDQARTTLSIELIWFISLSTSLHPSKILQSNWHHLLPIASVVQWFVGMHGYDICVPGFESRPEQSARNPVSPFFSLFRVWSVNGCRGNLGKVICGNPDVPAALCPG